MTDIQTPRSYAEWLPLLDRFAAGDDVVLDALGRGTIDWTNVVAERWTIQVADALAKRLDRLSKTLQTGMNRAGGDSFAIARAMLDARRALEPLFTLARLPGAPDQVRQHLGGELDRFVTQTQKSLEESSAMIRHDHGRVLKVLRDNPLTKRAEPIAAAVQSQTHGTCDGRGAGKRSILF